MIGKKKIYFRGVEIIWDENLGESDTEVYIGTAEQKKAVDKARAASHQANSAGGDPGFEPQYP